MMNRRPWMTAVLALGACSALSGCFLPLLAAGGVAGTAVVANDPRTSGAYVDDRAIEFKGGGQLSDKFPDAHVDINSYNRTVLLTGEVASDQERMRVEMTVRALPGVSRVLNYTVVAEPTTLGQRNNDAWITGKVKSRLISGEGQYSSSSVKLVTERGVLYIMGLVTRPQGDAIAAIASQTSGVQKVVTLYEYLNELPPLPGANAPAPAEAAPAPAAPPPVAPSPAATTAPATL